MKKKISLLLAAAMLFSFSACGANKKQTAQNTAPKDMAAEGAFGRELGVTTTSCLTYAAFDYGFNSNTSSDKSTENSSSTSSSATASATQTTTKKTGGIFNKITAPHVTAKKQGTTVKNTTTVPAQDKRYLVGGDAAILKKFSNTMSVEAIFKDIKNINLYHKMNTKGLTKQTVENKANSTTDIFYKNANGKIVYETGTGYGESFFKYHTKSASGKDVVCSYYNEGYDSVTIDSAYYSVIFTRLNSKKTFGADSVYVCSKVNDNLVLSSQIGYEYSDKWIPVYATYTDNKGYHIYNSWEEGKGKFASNDYVKYPRLTSTPAVNTKLLNAPELTIEPEFVFGSHKFSYLNTISNKWYITADFVLSFNTVAEREAYMQKYGIKQSSTLGNEDEGITLRTGKITVPVASDCKNFAQTVKTIEVDDCSYYTVSVNSNGEISEILPIGIYSYY